MSEPDFDYINFLREKFRTPAGLVAFLRAYDAPVPTDEAARKWFQRGAVPSGWFAVLLVYLELDSGSPVTLIPYRRQ